MNISFIIPVYNTKIDVLDNCINSIINQELKDYEIIIINDGSINQDLDIFCVDLSLKNDKIKYYYQTNLGSAVARNVGLENAKKDYIVFVDADDSLCTNSIKKLEIDDNDILICNYNVVTLNQVDNKCISADSNLLKYKSDIISNVLFYPDKMNNFMFGSIWGKVFKKSFLRENNILFVPKLRKAQDRMFMLMCYTKTENIKYENITIYNYNQNIHSITHKINKNMISYYYDLYVEMDRYCKNNNINNEKKFLEYSIVNELLLLTVFHLENQEKMKFIKNDYEKIIQKFNFNECIKNIKLKNFKKISGKIKFLLYKYKMISILKIYFDIKQRRNNKFLYKLGVDKNA